MGGGGAGEMASAEVGMLTWLRIPKVASKLEQDKQARRGSPKMRSDRKAGLKS